MDKYRKVITKTYNYKAIYKCSDLNEKFIKVYTPFETINHRINIVRKGHEQFFPLIKVKRIIKKEVHYELIEEKRK